MHVSVRHYSFIIMLKCLECLWLTCGGRNLIEVIVLLFPMDAFMIHFLFVWAVIALRSLRCEGDVTSFPPRINIVLGVTCSSSLTLLSLFAYFHILVSKIQFFSLTSSLLDLWRLLKKLTYFNIYKNEDCIMFPTWSTT